jgi:uncharacterized membrane protein
MPSRKLIHWSINLVLYAGQFEMSSICSPFLIHGVVFVYVRNIAACSCPSAHQGWRVQSFVLFLPTGMGEVFSLVMEHRQI